MSAPWRIASSHERGRHLVATAHINSGQLVLTQAPYSATLYDDQLPLRCDFTLADDVTLQRCSRCRVVSYRDSQAQRAAWRSGHKEECAALKQLAPRLPPATVRLAARVLWRRAREQKKAAGVGASKASEDALTASTYDDIKALEDHWQQLDDERKTVYAQMAVLTREYMQGAPDTKDEAPAPKEIAMLLARFACNNHTICDEELRPLGVGIYPLGALINHSCSPSAVQSFSGARINFRAIRHIKPGEEISISYIDQAAPRPLRRSDLLQQYFFDIDAGAGPAPVAAAEHELSMGSGAAAVQGGVQVHLAPPSPLDVGREALTAVTGAGGCTGSTGGVMAEIRRGGAQPSGVPSDDESESEDDMAGQRVGKLGFRGSWAGARPSPAAAEASAAEAVPEHELKVSCWGAVFRRHPPSEPPWQAAAGVAVGLLLGQHQAESLIGSGRQLEATRALQAALQHAEGAVIRLGPMHYLRMRAVAALMRAAIAAGMFEAAQEAARKLLPYYQLAYPEVWPDLGLHWASMAKLASVLGRDAEAAAAAEAACRVLTLTHGGGRVVNEMMHLRHELGQQMAMDRRQDD